jgi:hypothetical protein
MLLSLSTHLFLSSLFSFSPTNVILLTRGGSEKKRTKGKNDQVLAKNQTEQGPKQKAITDC